jgi:hypothetical protein
MASIRSFLGAAGIGIIALSAACGAPAGNHEETGSASEALIRRAMTKCGVWETVDCEDEGLGGKTLCSCIDDTPWFWQFTKEGFAANTQGLADYTLDEGTKATVAALDCSAPIRVNGGMPLFLCPTQVTQGSVKVDIKQAFKPLGVYSYTDDNGTQVKVPTCAGSTADGDPILPPGALACEGLVFFNTSDSGAVGTPITNYLYVLDAVYYKPGRSPIALSCPNGCPAQLVPPPGEGGGVSFFP